MKAPFVQLAARVPQPLRRALKLHCLKSEVRMEDFVAQALAERLERMASAGPGHGRAVPRR
jgi:hypothetical protein